MKVMDYSKSVKWFGKQMLAVLEDNDHKSPLITANLYRNLISETIELHNELLAQERNPNDIIKEAVDIANYALMIALDAKGKHLAQKHWIDPNWRYG